MIQEISVNTARRNEFKEITGEIQKAVSKGRLENGLCVVFVKHTTAGITINENADSSVRADILKRLTELVPLDAGYQHSEENSDAHIKASLMGFSVSVPVEKGRLLLGTWQGIYFCEFDGPRKRSLLVKLIQSP
ncbi:MAG: secondary thiamine-phosphate synthase enzyme YjbQ [Candidatus Firestonebacteria bacterium]|nr:secondary thiamine-phosphate synthase enzyme YjbQ [Candidatus Firestonebacteria bacterium]